MTDRNGAKGLSQLFYLVIIAALLWLAWTVGPVINEHFFGIDQIIQRLDRIERTLKP